VGNQPREFWALSVGREDLEPQPPVVGRVPRHIAKGGQRQCWLARLACDRGQVINERGAQPSRRVSARDAHLHDVSTVVDGRGEQIPHRTIPVGDGDPRPSDTDAPLELRDRRRLVGGDHPEPDLSKSLARITLDALQKGKLVLARRPDLVHAGAILPAGRREDRAAAASASRWASATARRWNRTPSADAREPPRMGLRTPPTWAICPGPEPRVSFSQSALGTAVQPERWSTDKRSTHATQARAAHLDRSPAAKTATRSGRVSPLSDYDCPVADLGRERAAR
jgi:hypothetical protein